MLELRERQPQRRARDLEPRRQPHLGETVAGAQLAVHDQLPQSEDRGEPLRYGGFGHHVAAFAAEAARRLLMTREVTTATTRMTP